MGHLPESGNALVRSSAPVVVGRFSTFDKSGRFQGVEKFALDCLASDFLKHFVKIFKQQGKINVIKLFTALIYECS
jgi:hypothetical protein